MKTIKFYTLGCKVNQYETQSIRERFIAAGFKELENCQAADFYLINTCTVTHRADAASLHLIRQAKRENPKAKIIVTGCLTGLDEDKIKNTDCKALIVKNKDKENILHYIKEILFNTNPREFLSNTHEFIRDNSVFNSSEFVFKGISFFKGHTRAFLKIQDGCSNNCSYCKVPLVRGPSRSRPLKEIIEEAGILVGSGYKEIVLTGICLGAYGKDLNKRVGLLTVIDGLEKIGGLFRIRLSSIEPQDISNGLIERIAQSKKVCPHLHIPLQSGDDDILKKMNRRYTGRDYLDLINKLKRLIPEISITTDVLVGFPGESEINFKNTLDLIKEVTPLKVHIFPYSQRQGTACAKMFSQKLPPLVIKDRIRRLKIVSGRLLFLYGKRYLNKKMDVLIESRCKEDSCYWEGFTGNYIKVKVKSKEDLKNRIVPVKLRKISNNSVFGVCG
jgi:threonylcarbamoyladenosine tRNA methylthiotransferase MtaB